MTTERPKIEKDFKELPLEQKISSLFRMEAATLEETFTYIVDSTKKAAEKAGEALSGFSTKVESEFKKATANAKTAKAPKAEAGEYQPPKSKPKASAKKRASGPKK